jgi:molecular chaperone Hsp33
MMEILAPSMRHDPDELFGTEAEIEIRCPRCAGRHAIGRAELAAFVAGRE